MTITDYYVPYAKTTATSNGDIIYPIWVKYNSDTTNRIIWNEWNNYYTTNDSLTIDSTESSTSNIYHYGYWVESQRAYRAEHPFVHIVHGEKEQSKRFLEEQKRFLEEQKGKQRKAEEAQKAAEELLLEHLTPEQREMYHKTKKFHVITASGRRYEINARGRAGNVKTLDDNGKQVESHCIHNSGGCPVPLNDNALAQKLLLEADEKEFRRIANTRNLAC